jgi:hypothetical protein
MFFPLIHHRNHAAKTPVNHQRNHSCAVENDALPTYATSTLTSSQQYDSYDSYDTHRGVTPSPPTLPVQQLSSPTLSPNLPPRGCPPRPADHTVCRYCHSQFHKVKDALHHEDFYCNSNPHRISRLQSSLYAAPLTKPPTKRKTADDDGGAFGATAKIAKMEDDPRRLCKFCRAYNGSITKARNHETHCYYNPERSLIRDADSDVLSTPGSNYIFYEKGTAAAYLPAKISAKYHISNAQPRPPASNPDIYKACLMVQNGSIGLIVVRDPNNQISFGEYTEGMSLNKARRAVRKTGDIFVEIEGDSLQNMTFEQAKDLLIQRCREPGRRFLNVQIRHSHV